MKKYVVFAGIGLVGCDTVELVEVPNLVVYGYLEEISRIIAIENANSFGYCQDEEYFGDEDSLGWGWDSTIGYYMGETYLEYYYEKYNPEKHDKLLEDY